MAKIISIGIQKGGCGKTTVTSIASWLLAKEHRVLLVDFDSQGNASSMLSLKSPVFFRGRSVLEACMEGYPEPYIYPVSDNLHLLPAEDLLSTFSEFVFREYKGDPSLVLRDTLNKVKDQYDYILIDLPPNLGPQTINGLCASDFAVVMLQSEPFAYDALDRYLETISHAQQQKNHGLRVAGILVSMFDARTTMDLSIAESARENYEDVVFNTTIRRKSKIKEFSKLGISDSTKAERDALEQYVQFVKELKQRVE